MFPSAKELEASAKESLDGVAAFLTLLLLWAPVAVIGLLLGCYSVAVIQLPLVMCRSEHDEFKMKVETNNVANVSNDWQT